MPEYQQSVGGDGQTAGATSAPTDTPNPVEATVGPVIQLEKGDIEFWMQVAQIVVLLLILRELRRGAL